MRTPSKYPPTIKFKALTGLEKVGINSTWLNPARYLLNQAFVVSTNHQRRNYPKGISGLATGFSSTL
jgi:hypothetical protein